MRITALIFAVAAAVIVFWFASFATAGPGEIFAPHAQVGDIGIFDGEAGKADRSTVLPLHAVPAPAHGVRGMTSSLAGDFNSAAPDWSATTGRGENPIGASQRAALDDEAARDQALQKYRDETPQVTFAHPIPDQPRPSQSAEQ